MENQDNIDINKPEPLQKKKLSKKEKRHTDFPGNPVKGRGLYKWSKFFFVLTILGTVLTGFVLVLPALLALLSGFILVLWFVVVVVVSLFTIFLIWSTDEGKSFFNGWREFGTTLFNSATDVEKYTNSLIPTILIIGGSLIIVAWSFISIGFCTDKARKKKYIGMMIALGIVTLIYVLFLIINLRKYYFL